MLPVGNLDCECYCDSEEPSIAPRTTFRYWKSTAVTDSARISPRTLRGFRDYLPEAAIQRERLVDIARQVYRSFGFSPIDTPALEYLEILTGKGGEETDRQLYKFQDHGGRWVGLRFDLTVPLARFAAQHVSELGLPFKRYHIATVWRGENTQRGRYREFVQCDFDTIGTRSVAADIETVLVIHDLFRAMGFEAFSIHLNNRMVLTGVLERLGLVGGSVAILRALDKLGKIGPERVAEEMCQTAGLRPDQAHEVLRLAHLTGTNDQILCQLEPLVHGTATGQEGTSRLAEVLAGARSAGVPDERLKLDVAIARGLDYYTGTVVETYLDALPQIGSVCSGGRYDHLAGLFTDQEMPGIGASLGLDRLLAAMEQLGMIEKVATPAPVLVAFFDPARLHDYLRLARAIRAAGIGAEVYPEPRKLGHQLRYADRRGCRAAVIAGSQEFDAGHCQLKDLGSGNQQTVPLEPDAASLVFAVKRLLGIGT